MKSRTDRYKVPYGEGDLEFALPPGMRGTVVASRPAEPLADVEAAVPEALSHGSFFFADIQQKQVDAAGLALLRFLAAQGEGAVVSREALARHFPNELDRTFDLLTRRELIEPAHEGYRFQVELIRRWFARQVR